METETETETERKGGGEEMGAGKAGHRVDEKRKEKKTKGRAGPPFPRDLLRRRRTPHGCFASFLLSPLTAHFGRGHLVWRDLL
jgi:hypothetical protein